MGEEITKKKVPPPEVGSTVWICISEHYYQKAWYPELYKNDSWVPFAPAPAKADVRELLFFETGSKLKPEVVCVSHLHGNQNNMHYVRWPGGLGKYLFYSKDECVAQCEKLADACDNAWFGDPVPRPWRYREVI